jgi:Mrp family chromosome partitioning ATPase
VVTSALKGEGKTTCAINLALCIADETFARVLLLEANRQRPSLARVFGVPTLHDGGSDLATTSRHRVLGSSGPRLHIASALAYATHCGGLDRALFGGALHELREVYDYIVVDTASVLESADVDVAAECAGGVIVAARAGRSRRGPLERAIAQLSPANVCGVVLLDI